MSSSAPRVGAVLLAAGGASRFRAAARVAGLSVPHKLLAPLRNRTVFECALMNVIDAGILPIAVVLGAIEPPVTDRPHIHVLRNERWAEGQATSLSIAVAWADQAGLDALVCGLADQPFVESGDWRAVATTEPEAAIVVATYGGKRRNPVRLARSIWPLLPTTGDEGARSVIAGNPAIVVEVACHGNPADIDTPEDLLRWS